MKTPEEYIFTYDGQKFIMLDKEEKEGETYFYIASEDLKLRIVDGADFIKEAELHSACPSGKQNGGSLGWFGRGMMVKEFEDAAFSMRPGDLSDVIETQFGYHIISVYDREDARQLEFEEVKTEAVNAATSIAKEMERSRFIEELKAKATIER